MKKVPRIRRECIHCKKIFYVERWELKWKKCLFCSRKCSNAYNLYKRPQTYKKGHSPWNKDKKLPQFSEDSAYQWKGDEVGYGALHKWVAKRLGKPTTCSHCGKTNLSGRLIHWANKSGEYKRELNDWIRLCVWCHGKFDGTLIKKGQHLSTGTEFKEGAM